jgi:hypothetical protein
MRLSRGGGKRLESEVLGVGLADRAARQLAAVVEVLDELLGLAATSRC